MKIYFKKEQKNKSRKIEFILLVVMSIIVTASFILKTEGQHTIVLPGGKSTSGHLCLFYQATGYPDLGCGLTRSFINTAHFNLAKAFYFHFLGPLLFTLTLLTTLYLLYRVLGGKNKITINWTRRQAYLTLAITVIIAISAWITKLCLGYF